MVLLVAEKSDKPWIIRCQSNCHLIVGKCDESIFPIAPISFFFFFSVTDGTVNVILPTKKESLSGDALNTNYKKKRDEHFCPKWKNIESIFHKNVPKRGVVNPLHENAVLDTWTRKTYTQMFVNINK